MWTDAFTEILEEDKLQELDELEEQEFQQELQNQIDQQTKPDASQSLNTIMIRANQFQNMQQQIKQQQQQQQNIQNNIGNLTQGTGSASGDTNASAGSTNTPTATSSSWFSRFGAYVMGSNGTQNNNKNPSAFIQGSNSVSQIQSDKKGKKGTGEVKKVRGATFPLPLTGDSEDIKSLDENKANASSPSSPSKRDNTSNDDFAARGIRPSLSTSSLPQSTLGEPLTPKSTSSGTFLSTSSNNILDHTNSRVQKFNKILFQPTVDLEQLRKLSWGGVPDHLRHVVWALLTGYLPCNSDRRQATLERKRREYWELVPQYYDSTVLAKTEYEISLQRQIHIDIPRTNPDIPLLQDDRIQLCLERILYIWSVRHPASGYVQGLNDLVTPFIAVFLTPHIPTETDVLVCNVNEISQEVLNGVEADSFWCFSKLLDSIQDHYTFAQPGIQRLVHKVKEIVARIDKGLHDHLDAQGLQFIQFAFRWVNCLLMRELSIPLITRLWDTYLAEGDDFASLHVYVCAAFLTKWSTHLKTLDFTDLVLFLQHMPTKDWTNKDIEILLSQAFVYKELFDRSPSHYAN